MSRMCGDLLVGLWHATRWRWLLRCDTRLATRRLKRKPYDPLRPLWGDFR
jgi:hypothetical protein